MGGYVGGVPAPLKHGCKKGDDDKLVKIALQNITKSTVELIDKKEYFLFFYVCGFFGFHNCWYSQGYYVIGLK